MTAAKLVRCVLSFSRVSFSPAATVQRGLTAQRQLRCISSIRKNGEAAVKVDVHNPQTDASNFMNKTGLKPAEVDVGNGLRADVIRSPFTSTSLSPIRSLFLTPRLGNERLWQIGILKQTGIMDEACQPTSFDMQATTPMDPHVLNAMLPVYTGLYRNPNLRIHTYGWGTEKAIDVACKPVAQLIGAHPTEIRFTSGAMESNNMSIRYVAKFYKSKKHTITSQTEHKCVLDSCRHLQDEWYNITYLPVNNNGLIDREHLEKIRPDTVPVSIMVVSNEIRLIQLIEEIGKRFRKMGVFFQTDGSQAVGKIPVKVGEWNVDLMGILGPKAYGPTGIGGCYTRRRPKVRIDPLISGGGPERGLHSGTLAHPLVISFREAYRIAKEEIKYTRTLERFFSRNSICSPTMQDGNYIHKGYHNKQPIQFIRTLRTMGHEKADSDRKRGRCKATTEDSRIGIQEANFTKVPNTKENQNTNRNRRNLKRTTSYSQMTIHEAQMRLNVELTLPGIPVRKMLEGRSVLLGQDVILKAKRKIYEGLVGYLDAAGYPTEANPDLKEANINDIVAFTIYPILALFKHETTRELRLSREKEIASPDSSTGGMEEFAVMDYISLNQMKYVLVVEAKKVSLGEARKQCFLSMKDMRDCNGGGTVYGFVTMGDTWRMISFDGKFKISEKIELLFDTMGNDEEQWMSNYSILIECFNVALSNGAKDLAEVV